jgi:CBS domain-containing protein
MTSPVTTIDCEMDVLEAAHLMAERGIRRLPVADKGRLIGIISYSDVARAFDQALRDIVVGQAREAAPVD